MPNAPCVDAADLDRLIAYIRARQLNDFVIVPPMEPYGHLGATLADAVLQANNRYEPTVKGRIDRIRASHPSCDTLPALCRWLEADPGDRMARAREFLDWKGDRRAGTLLDIADLLRAHGVNTEAELGVWLTDCAHTKALRDLPFVGPKTVDYLGILVGAERFAMDRRLFAFLRAADVRTKTYAKAQALLMTVADRLGIAPRVLDHSIWRDDVGSGAKQHASCVVGA